jgi:hypothetical protein
MSIETIKEEVAKLSEKEQRSLIGYIVSLRNQTNDEHRRILAEERDNKDPNNWVPFSEVQRQLRELDARESS